MEDLTCSMTEGNMIEVDGYVRSDCSQCGLKVNPAKRGMTSLLQTFTPTMDIEITEMPTHTEGCPTRRASGGPGDRGCVTRWLG